MQKIFNLQDEYQKKLKETASNLERIREYMRLNGLFKKEEQGEKLFLRKNANS